MIGPPVEKKAKWKDGKTGGVRNTGRRLLDGTATACRRKQQIRTAEPRLQAPRAPAQAAPATAGGAAMSQASSFMPWSV
jgi:hypothetical protein